MSPRAIVIRQVGYAAESCIVAQSEIRFQQHAADDISERRRAIATSVRRFVSTNDGVRERADDGELEFDDGRGVRWTTGMIAGERGKSYRWFRADGRLERRYDLQNGEAKDESVASLRAQLHASIVVR